MQGYRNTNLLHNESDQGCICRTYKTIPEKSTLPLYGRSWIQVHSQTDSIRYNTGRKCSIDLITKNVRTSDFLSILYSKPQSEFNNPNFKSGGRVRISKGYKPQVTQKGFEIVAISSRKSQTYAIKYEQDEEILDKFRQKELLKIIQQGIAYNGVGL